jgi:hypothetical protein
MPHDLNGHAEIHFYRGSEQPLEAVIEGNPDLTQPGHDLEFYLANWYDEDDVLISKTKGNGIEAFADGRYRIDISAEAYALVLKRPYKVSVWYSGPTQPRDVTAQTIFRVVGTVGGS